MKTLISASFAALFALSLGTAQAQAQADSTKPNPKMMKKLNTCNKQAKGKSDDAYREAMKACMDKQG